MRILYAGGCHVSGHLVRAGESFPEILSSKLQERGELVESKTISHLKLDKLKGIEELCEIWEPDLVIRQPGHFELTVSLASYFKVKRGASSDVIGPSNIFPYKFHFNSYWYGKAFLKFLIDTVLSHPLIKWKYFEMAYQNFINRIDLIHGPTFILLSPFPCMDFTANYYRKRANAIILGIVPSHNVHYIDLFKDAIHRDRTVKIGLFADAGHLNRSGHLWVFNSIWKTMQNLNLFEAQSKT